MISPSIFHSSHIPSRNRQNIDFVGIRRKTMEANLPFCCFSSNLPGMQAVENTRALHPGAMGAGARNNGCFDYFVPLRSIPERTGGGVL